MVIKATAGPPGLSLLDRRQPAATNERDELIPLGMAQLNNVAGLADPDACGVDGYLRAGIALRAQA
ncbi:MAG TPA: hypothetical protein VNE67_04480, partial [Acetobacteraceae bacterium]|nr:hypothetical protein [Acetobacteraceae bacterium]